MSGGKADEDLQHDFKAIHGQKTQLITRTGFKRTGYAHQVLDEQMETDLAL